MVEEQKNNGGWAAGTSPAIVLVDDEPAILFGSALMLRQAGLQSIHAIEDSRELLPYLNEKGAGVIVLDLQMPHLSGRDLLDELAAQHPEVPVIVVTAANELDTVVECMKRGAFDYLVKPMESERFVATVKKALEVSLLRREVSSLRKCLTMGDSNGFGAFSAIRTKSPRMHSIFRYLQAVATTGQPVLVTGETGVGKELVARALHDLSGRQGRFVALNSAGLDDPVFADTIFGHGKGAFTGADSSRDGMIARAADGTLFLDEIGELSSASQLKLLRLLQDGEYYPLGMDAPVTNRARIVVATNVEMHELMAGGRFRKDLFYRLCAHRVHIPPLRERLEDLSLLVDVFLEEAAQMLQTAKPECSPDVLECLAGYHFPGNVRELKAMILDAVTRHEGGKLGTASFRDIIGRSRPTRAIAGIEDEVRWATPGAPFPTIKQTEERLIAAALQRSSGNQRAAAALLGISRQALNQRLMRKL